MGIYKPSEISNNNPVLIALQFERENPGYVFLDGMTIWDKLSNHFDDKGRCRIGQTKTPPTSAPIESDKTD